MKPSFAQQERFFGVLRSLLPGHLNLAGEMAAVLEISQDSAYRRIRCETALTLDETVALSLHFGVPLEALNNEIPDVVTFQFSRLESSSAGFSTYIVGLTDQLRRIAKAEQKRIVYAAEDIPLFHHFAWPYLGMFKAFYWMKSILNVPESEPEKFPPEALQLPSPEQLSDLYDIYAVIPGTEIWTEATIESSLQQIRFYWDAGFIGTRADALRVCDELEGLLRRVQRQTETGQKINAAGASTGVEYTFYLCDLMIGNNSVFTRSGERKTTFIGYNSFNYIHTHNRYFIEQSEYWMDNLIRKSILLSGVAEKLRNQFFKRQLQKVEQLKEYISRQ